MENILNNKEKSVQRYAEGFHLIDKWMVEFVG